jgi:multiple sugar transport system permease protein
VKKPINHLEKETRRLIIPSLSILLLLGVIPLTLLFVMSFYKLELGRSWSEAKFVGFENWIWLFFSPIGGAFKALGRTLVFSFSCIIEGLIGFVIATLIHRRQMRGMNVVATVLIIPTVLTPAMVGMVWRLYFTNNSIIDYFLNTFFHLDINWMSSNMAMIAVIIVSVWQYTPFWIVTLLAAMKLQPKEPYQAAIVDGANEWQQIRYILMPYLMPSIQVLFILRIIQNFIGFDMIYALTGGVLVQ